MKNKKQEKARLKVIHENEETKAKSREVIDRLEKAVYEIKNDFPELKSVCMDLKIDWY